MKKFLKANQLENVFNNCPEERETTISISGTDQMMDIYTSDNSMITKLKKILDANPDTVECWEAGRFEDGKVSGYHFKMDKKHLSLRSSVGREMSEEAKNAFRERVKQMHAEGKLGRKK